jgi:hypothetical protein
VTKRPRGSTKIPPLAKLADGSVARALPSTRPHPDETKPTRELDPDLLDELVRAAGGGEPRRTRKFETAELRALGVAPPPEAPSPSRTVTPRTLAKAGPIVVIERYRKLPTGKHKSKPRPR